MSQAAAGHRSNWNRESDHLDPRFEVRGTSAILRSVEEFSSELLFEAEDIVFVLHQYIVERLAGGRIELAPEGGILLLGRDGATVNI